jgi:RNA polymerase sigma-70 factor (ECF subfamily)
MDPDRTIDPDRWVDLHGDALYGFAMIRLGDPEASAEVVQEAFLAALRSRSSFSGRSSERTWLIGILKHKILDHLRRRRRADWRDELAPTVFFDESENWREKPSRWVEDAAGAVDRQEFWEVLRLCLGELPPIYAEAFTLHEIDGHETGEICELLGITATNLNSRLHRARLMLRSALERRWFGRGARGR